MDYGLSTNAMVKKEAVTAAVTSIGSNCCMTIPKGTYSSILGNSPQKNRDFLLSVYGNYAIFAAE